jgi:hypothetical protein
MNSSRWLNERALLAISRAAIRSHTAPQPRLLTRSFGILQPANRIFTRNPRTRCPRIVETSRTAPSRQGTRKFWANSSKSSSNPTPHLGSPEPAPSLSQRLRKLSREYGWSALGVYLALSALDFPFCFLGVRLLGTERIGRWEHVVIGAFWDVVRIPFPDFVHDRQAAQASQQASEPVAMSVDSAHAAEREGSIGWSSSVAQAQADNVGTNASTYLCHDLFEDSMILTFPLGIWTQLALAYAIHKSFIFIRVPITAAVTPKVVKTLRGWGWDIGKRTPKPTST